MALAVAIVLLTSCAATLTPAQQDSYDTFAACQRETSSVNVRLVNVAPDGSIHWTHYGGREERAMMDCLRAHGHRLQGEGD